jgi:hypothetical protein
MAPTRSAGSPSGRAARSAPPTTPSASSASRPRSTVTSRPAGPSSRAAAASAAGPGGWLPLRWHGRTAREGAEHDAFKRRPVLGRPDQLAGAGRCQTMGCQQRSRRRGHLQRSGAEPVTQHQLRADQTGRDTVAVAAEGHRGVGVHRAADLHGGRIRRGRKGQQRLGIGQRTHGRGTGDPPSGHGRGRASPTVARNRSSDPCAWAIVAAVMVRTSGRTQTAPPPPPSPCGWPAATGRAGPRRRRAWPPEPSLAARRWCRARSPSPADRCARSWRCPKPAQHAVDRLDQMRLVGRLGQHAPDPPRGRQAAKQHLCGAAPRRPATLQPVPLQLRTWRLVDLDRGLAASPCARLAVWAQLVDAQLASEAHLAQAVAEPAHLVVQALAQLCGSSTKPAAR